MVLSHYLAHDYVPETTDGDDNSIRTTEDMEKYESLHCREFAHTRIYDVNLFERVGLDEELVVGLNPPTGVDKQHESREARSLYPSALQLTRALRLEFIGRAT
jgi:hypothetical protein